MSLPHTDFLDLNQHLIQTRPGDRNGSGCNYFGSVISYCCMVTFIVIASFFNILFQSVIVSLAKWIPNYQLIIEGITP